MVQEVHAKKKKKKKRRKKNVYSLTRGTFSLPPQEPIHPSTYTPSSLQQARSNINLRGPKPILAIENKAYQA